MTDRTSTPRRDYGMAAVAAVILLAAAYAAWRAHQAGGWWLAALVPIVAVLVLGAYGLGDSLQEKPRKED